MMFPIPTTLGGTGALFMGIVGMLYCCAKRKPIHATLSLFVCPAVVVFILASIDGMRSPELGLTLAAIIVGPLVYSASKPPEPEKPSIVK